MCVRHGESITICCVSQLYTICDHLPSKSGYLPASVSQEHIIYLTNPFLTKVTFNPTSFVKVSPKIQPDIFLINFLWKGNSLFV